MDMKKNNNTKLFKTITFFLLKADLILLCFWFVLLFLFLLVGFQGYEFGIGPFGYLETFSFYYSISLFIFFFPLTFLNTIVIFFNKKTLKISFIKKLLLAIFLSIVFFVLLFIVNYLFRSMWIHVLNWLNYDLNNLYGP